MSKAPIQPIERCGMTPEEFRTSVPMSKSTWRRLRANNDTPVLTWISQRRYIIRPEHVRDWLDRRAKPAADDAAS